MSESEANDDAGGAEEGVSEFVTKTGPENQPALAKELLRTESGDVRANTVAMERAGAEQVHAQRVIMTNSGARSVDARSAQIDRSGVLAVKSEKAVFYNSSAIAVAAEHARIVRGRVFMLKSDNATIEGDARIGIYAGPAVDGVRPLVDVRGAAAFGAGAGLVVLVAGNVLRRMLRKR